MTEAGLLEHIRKLPHGRATYKQLVKELRLQGENRAELDAILNKLSDRGSLVELKGGNFAAVGANSEYVAGRLSLHRDGFGFLVPDPGARGFQGDVFLPPKEAEKGMHGDRALVQVTRVANEGRAEGEIVRILRRAHMTVVGEFHIRRRGNFVAPSDDRIRQWIEIPEGMEIPPRRAAADRVGAEPRKIESVADMEGMIVNVEILEFPEAGDAAVGRVVEVLGFANDFGVDVEIMIRKHHLPHEFSEDVLTEAQSFSTHIPEAELGRRRDFRSFDIVTIDGETARDFDDALWVDKLPSGNFSLQVHIADVSHYVQPGSAIDHEAVMRGTSVYFPDRAVPMLPVELSTNICSLRPDEDRLVLSALLEFDREGELVSQEFTRGVIRSAQRMTYTDVHRVLEGDPGLRERYEPLLSRFEMMRELALLLNRRRKQRGSVDFDMPEANIQLDVAGQMVGVSRGERNIAHRLIEEFMLAANEAVARHLETAEIPSLYRIHEKPEGKRVAEFELIAAHFGYSLGVGAIPVKKYPMVQKGRDGRKIRRDYEIPQEVNITSRNYQKLIAKIAGKPEERILSYLMLRSLKQARYSNVNEGHFALAAPSYTHFTSPIRRYPDLIVHRILKHHMDTQKPLLTEPLLHEIGNDTSFTERRAAEAERELLEIKKVIFMQERVGEEFDAIIISTTKFGFFVELADLFIEGLVPLETLPGDRYQYQENVRKIVGERTRKTFAIGDSARVRLDRADPVDRKLQFAMVEQEPRRRSKKK